MRFYIALWVSKLYLFYLKCRHLEKDDRPGSLALKICPSFLAKVNRPKLLIGITGTNGKTTTTNLLADLLKKLNKKIIYNDWGANTKRGMARCLLEGVNIFNNSKNVIAILEMDEVTCDETLPVLKPNYLLVTNLFRDSMFRNPNPHYVFDKIYQGLVKETTLILNADDAFSSELSEKGNPCIYYGISFNEKKMVKNIVNDFQICPKCQHLLHFKTIIYHHIGEVFCPYCGFASKKRDYLATIDFTKKEINVSYNNQQNTFPMIHDSIFNCYNELLVITMLLVLDYSFLDIFKAISSQTLTKRRYQKEKIENVEIITMACKGFNPIALASVFAYLKEEKEPIALILLLDDRSDRINSCEAVNYLYDADFEFLNQEKIQKIIIGGKRCYDYQYRCLLAGIAKEKIIPCINEDDVINYVDLKTIKKVYILHDVLFYSGANDIKNALMKRGVKNESRNIVS